MEAQRALNQIQTVQRIVGEDQLRELLNAVQVFGELPEPDGHERGKPFWYQLTIKKHCQGAASYRIPSNIRQQPATGRIQ